MTAHNQYTKDEYRELLASQNTDFRDALYNKMPLIIDSYLMTYGEVSDYSGHRHFAATLVDALLLYLTADGWVQLTEKASASLEVRAKNLQDFADTKAASTQTFGMSLLDLRTQTEN